MAVMLSAQHQGLPLTEELYARLTAETPWKGNVERLYGRWASKRDAYEWAMETIQPQCHPNILFTLGLRSDWTGNPWTLYDYAVASRGFAFWLDDADPEERSIIEEICRKGNFKPGAIVMGYAKSGDDLLYVTNRYNIGYVVSDYYANGSFWCSYPNKSFKQRPAKPSRPRTAKSTSASYSATATTYSSTRTRSTPSGPRTPTAGPSPSARPSAPACRS